MNVIRRIIPLASLLLFTACSQVEPTVTYEENIHQKMKIPYVFVPPTNAYPPYTLLHYVEGEGFQQVCQATSILNVEPEKLPLIQVESDIANTEISKNHMGVYGVHLTKEEIGTANIAYGKVKEVRVSLSNGKQISMPSVSISQAFKNMEEGPCADDIRVFDANIENSKFYIPREVYKYTMKYSIIDQDGINITAGLSSSLQKVILAKAGINISDTEGMKIEGEDLFIGFRGIPVNLNTPEVKALRSTTVLDVTELVKRIKSSK
ncbi:hypothetical protein KKC13_09750 [bacterium]|nr:hypothetical protein [bacterium]MBU1958063.1 hypothetical protein [bacterium]